MRVYYVFSSFLDAPSNVVAKAVTYAIAIHCNIVVIPLGSRTMNSTLLHDAIEQASSQNIAVIVSAGNEGPSRG